MRRFLAVVCRAAWLRPSLADLLLVSLIGWLFVAGEGWTVLLADGDTGWHIRAGQWMLETRSVPHRDIFSFTRSAEAWYAWEWLAGVLFALVHAWRGLAGVAGLAGCTLALGALLVFRYMLWRGAQALVALPVTLLCVGASSIHYLARPHIFTLLLMPAAWWMVERDRRHPGKAVWWLVPLSAVWVNLHGGFFALPACLLLLAAGLGIEAVAGRSYSLREAFRLRKGRTGERSPAAGPPPLRYALLGAATLAASLANPYGIGLHRHIARYLTSDWIRSAVDEFQSPRFRGENLLHFELLLIAGLLTAGWLLSRGRVADALLVVAWAHLALASVRHVPLFVMLASPLVAAEVSALWRARAEGSQPRSVCRLLWQFGADLTPVFRRLSVWSAAAVAAAILATPASKWPRDFPEAKFPVSLLKTVPANWEGRRVFTTDQWGDYLIYRHWPRLKVFIDGRSDFYGPGLGGEYLRLVEGRPGWDRLLDKHGLGLVLVPGHWPLASLLEGHPGWRRIASDERAALYARAAGNGPNPATPPGR
ncbi:MAG: hypothetical protein IT159_05815 [Bryobacterales bacterium]|nr:hypothetical protein [Bryobacterales bacterium]